MAVRRLKAQEPPELPSPAKVCRDMQCPHDVPLDAWVHVKSFEAWEQVQMAVNALTHTGPCTRESCPVMCTGPGIVFDWVEDGVAQPERASAQEYMERLAEWSDSLFQDLKRRGYATPDCGPYPQDFWPLMRRMHRRLFRVFAHVYLHHIDDLRRLGWNGVEGALDTSFHFWFTLTRSFDLVDEEELEPLRDEVQRLRACEEEADPRAPMCRGMPAAPLFYDQGTVEYEEELPDILTWAEGAPGPVIIPDEQVWSERGSQAIVQCPPYVDRNQWIAKKSFELWNEVRMLFSALTSRGVSQKYDAMCNCPVLYNGHSVCQWREGGSVPLRLSAEEHMYRLVNHVHAVLTNRSLVPQDGSPFPQAFLPEMMRVHRLLFQVFAHAMLHHFEDFGAGTGRGKLALRCSFAHWFFFVREFGLVSDRDLSPLRSHIEGLQRQDGCCQVFG